MRFYGGTAHAWLFDVPVVLLWASIEMLPRLQAEEAMEAMHRVAVGSGSVSAQRSRELQTQWIRQAAGLPAPTPEAPPRPRTRASVEAIRRVGLSVRLVPRSPARTGEGDGD